MHAIIEFIPLLLFFIVFKLADIYWATALLMATTFIQVAYSYLKVGRVPTRQWLFLALAIILGTLTLVFHDAQFVKLKATIIYAGLAISLIVSRYIFAKNLVQKALESMLNNAFDTQQPIAVPKATWEKLNLVWIIITASVAALNLYIAYNFPLDIWVNFKVFGLMAITFVSIFASILALYKYFPEDNVKPSK
ncbi:MULTISPECIES: inner membrane-spanning protein YciB [unclassified Pseudoalteromonas]|uniref:inner membrane-spanning protein YciB n=1 Tax=unclassified Pseudoalteromonas TaxID=194690 RepID=UPI000B3C32AE|nr:MULTISPECIES: inner membrane-spanning protein YciB [unclassified Pseudoalteromonas]MDN3377621.1 inner membrane-spanning protein YciB [Pseudoalteromonas sp. APC 3893]MDN3385817.1 inner membrane-spanning protein YciB [Pseudoalteromonas sp. APC 4017]OUS72795.1 intracellular septation protein A [Pseudoalteromonas sp. A601]